MGAGAKIEGARRCEVGVVGGCPRVASDCEQNPKELSTRFIYRPLVVPKSSKRY